MALYTLDELVAYQLSLELKKRVFDLIYNSPACKDLKFAGQVTDAVSSLPSDVAEGFYRFNPAEFAQFVKYARSSLQDVLRSTEKRHWANFTVVTPPSRGRSSRWRGCI